MSIPIAPPTFQLSTKELYIETAFTSTWETTTANTSITIPTASTYNYDGTIDWGDGSGEKTFTTHDDANLTHEYADADTYTVTIDGTFEYFDGTKSQYKPYLKTVENLGSVGWKTMHKAFYYANALVSFNAGFADLSEVTNFERMFYSCNTLETVSITNCDLSNMTNMSYCMRGCAKLKTVSMTNCDLSNMTNMSDSFAYSSSLSAVDFSNSDFSGVTTSTNIWQYAYSMNTLNLSGVTLPTSSPQRFTSSNGYVKHVNMDDITSSSNTLASLFSRCNNLETISMDNFPSHITDVNHMFSYNSSITSVDILSGVDLSHVTNINNMFSSCSNLTDISGFADLDMSLVTNMSRVFSNCSNLVDANLDGLSGGNVTDMSYFMRSCSKLKTVSITNCDLSNVTNMSSSFGYNTSLSAVDFSNSDFSGVTNNSDIWQHTYSMNTLNLSGVTLPTSAPQRFTSNNIYVKHVNMDDITSSSNTLANLFLSCNNLETISMDNFPSHITDVNHMFSYNSSITSVDILSGVDLSHVTNINNLFSGCSNLTDISGFVDLDMPLVTNMSWVFYSCSNLVDANLDGLSGGNVTDMSYFMRSCTKLETISMTNCDLSNVTNMSNSFGYNSSLSAVDFSNSDFSGVTSSSNIWFSTTSMDTLNLSGVTLPASPSKLTRYCVAPTINISNAVLTSTTISAMFYNSSNLTTLDVTGFDISSVTSSTSFIKSTSLTTASYSDMLIEFESQAVQDGIVIDASNAKYNTSGETARAALIADHGWSFTDGGLE